MPRGLCPGGFVWPCHWQGGSDPGGYVRGFMSANHPYTILVIIINSSSCRVYSKHNSRLVDAIKRRNDKKPKAIPSLRHCCTDRTYYLLPITRREHTSMSLGLHVVHKITIIRAQKIGKSAVWNSYYVVASYGGAEKNVNMRAQLKAIDYKKSPKLFFIIARLNSYSVVVLPCTFGTTCTNLTVFRSAM